MKKITIPFFLLLVAMNAHSANEISQDGCTTKLKQVMRPEYPAARIGGYSEIQFDILKDGKVTNISSSKSMCIRHNRKEDSYAFRQCGIFISNSIAATYYMEYKPPTDERGESCSITDHKHRYRFRAKRSEKIDAAFDKEFAENPIG